MLLCYCGSISRKMAKKILNEMANDIIVVLWRRFFGKGNCQGVRIKAHVGPSLCMLDIKPSSLTTMCWLRVDRVHICWGKSCFMHGTALTGRFECGTPSPVQVSVFMKIKWKVEHEWSRKSSAEESRLVSCRFDEPTRASSVFLLSLSLFPSVTTDEEYVGSF